MPEFSQTSKEKLATCDERLQKIFNEVIKYYDCTIVCGHRDEAEQIVAVLQGRSKVNFPDSKHNKKPSLAVDAMPCPIDWNDKIRIYHFMGFVKGIAQSMGIKLRWGGDWNSNNVFKDEKFADLPHVELVE